MLPRSRYFIVLTKTYYCGYRQCLQFLKTSILKAAQVKITEVQQLEGHFLNIYLERVSDEARVSDVGLILFIPCGI